MVDIPRAFVAGHPIGHSRSPLIHTHWLETMAIAGSYEAIDVAPDELKNQLREIRKGQWRGGNFTIPHKEEAFARTDRHDAAAEAIGAVNTIWIEGDHLVGANSDAYGFAQNLNDFAPQWRDGETALLIGAGGASRAVIHALLENGYDRILVANRTMSRVAPLTERFGPNVQAVPFVEIDKHIAQADIIINASALGMVGHPPLEIDLSSANSNIIVTDLVYTPLKTDLLKQAENAGLVSVNGLGMLLHQAALGFSKWFGAEPPVDQDLRDKILRDIANSGSTS